MQNTESKSYETPEVIVSLDALGMIGDADAVATQTCQGSVCEVISKPN